MTLKTTQLTAITAASCSAKPASCDAAAITLKQVCSDHGFDDYDVAGHPEIYRVCVGHGLKHGDVFNVYGPAGKRGATWCGNLEASLARSLCVNADIVGVADPQALSRPQARQLRRHRSRRSARITATACLTTAWANSHLSAQAPGRRPCTTPTAAQEPTAYVCREAGQRDLPRRLRFISVLFMCSCSTWAKASAAGGSTRSRRLSMQSSRRTTGSTSGRNATWLGWRASPV